MFLIVCALVLLHGCSGDGVRLEDSHDARQAYRQWISMFPETDGGRANLKRSFSPARFAIFKRNFELIRTLLGKHLGYHLILNKFADKTDAEMAGYTGANATEMIRGAPLQSIKDVAKVQGIPSQIDHRFITGLNQARDIGFTNCGAAWAFSAVAVIESHYNRITGEKCLLSEQEILDCTYGGKLHGCSGGSVSYAFSYVKHELHLADRRDYKYIKRSQSCHKNNFRSAMPKAKIDSFYALIPGDDNLINEVATRGPVAVFMHSPRSLKFYDYGIYDAYGCAGEDPNHAVVVVGYQPDRWIIRNSWGLDWGMWGNFYLTRKFQNICKISTFPITATMVKTNVPADRCEDVPTYHRQYCWGSATSYISQSSCEQQGCCYDPGWESTNKCFVKGKITFYTKPNFGGIAATFYGTVNDFDPYDFAKAPASVIVHYGRFIAYEKENFGEKRGNSLYTLGVGRYSDLDVYGFRHRIKSLRALPGNDIITLFMDTHGRGESTSILRYSSNVGDYWNDETSSIYSESKSVDVCRHSQFRDCKRYGPGLTTELDCNDCLTSVSLVY